MTVLITFSQEMDMFSLSEPNNTWVASHFQLVILCLTYVLVFPLCELSVRELLHISTWLAVQIISISTTGRWLCVTKQIPVWVCRTNTWGKQWLQRSTALGSWGISNWFLHRFTYYWFTAAVLSLQGLKASITVFNVFASVPGAVSLTDASTVPSFDDSH